MKFLNQVVPLKERKKTSLYERILNQIGKLYRVLAPYLVPILLVLAILYYIDAQIIN